ncbi:MAG: tetratricopeptide repeat protein [Alphaproteobacteria bacterium]
MSEQAAKTDALGEQAMESTARDLSEFVIRTLVLPVTIFFTHPRVIKRGAEGGSYRPLPSPFLLALVTGVVVSGVFLAAIAQVVAHGDDYTQSRAAFFNGVTSFYTGTADGVRAVLFAIPFVAGVWVLAGLLSLMIGRKLEAATPIFAMFAYCLAALVEVAGLGLLIAIVWSHDASEDTTASVICMFSVGAYALVLGIKFIRLLLSLKSQNGPRWLVWVGTVSACIPLLLIIVANGLVSGVFLAFFLSQPFSSVARGNADYDRADYDAAIKHYDQAIEANPRDAEAFYRRARAFSAKNDNIRAMANFEQAIRLNPEFSEALASRAYQFRSDGARDPHAFQLAIADLDREIQLSPLYSGAFYDRCLTRAYAGTDLDMAVEDCEEALRLVGDDKVWRARYTMAHGLAKLRGQQFDEALHDYDSVVKSQEPGLTGQDRAAALFGRGVARVQLGNAADGYADMAAARKQDSNAGWEFETYGMVGSDWKLIAQH